MIDTQRQFDENEDANARGAYMASLSEDYFYATHPKERPWLMDKVEVKRIIKEYESFGLPKTQNPPGLSTSAKAKL